MSEKLEQAGKTGQWFSICKYLASDEMPERWNIAELSPDVPPIELANNLADHFSQIANLAPPLKESDIPLSNTGPGMIPQLTLKNVTEVLKHYKKQTVGSRGTYQRN